MITCPHSAIWGRLTMRLRKSKLLTVALLLVRSALHAQDARSTILGRVTDPTGAVIAGAIVEAANGDTGVRATAPTNASGDFLFPFLIPGPYSLKVEAP